MAVTPPRWRRVGLLGNPAGSAPWAATHAALPAVDPSEAVPSTLFVSCRDADGRARIGRCGITLGAGARLSALEEQPVLDLGSLGAFDDSGVTMSCLVSHAGTKYLFYTGWTRGVTVPFYLAIGLAVSTDGGRTFARVSPAPLLERSAEDPYLSASPCVLIENGIWRMWYISGTGWERTTGDARHFYHVKYTESDDGLAWRRPRRVAIDYGAPDEHAFGRPCVVRDADAYRMWYAYRGSRYRIGGAESADGLSWTRRDDAMGLAAPGEAWEREMVAYPWIVDAAGVRSMVYNGDDYGRTGVGLAVWR